MNAVLRTRSRRGLGAVLASIQPRPSAALAAAFAKMEEAAPRAVRKQIHHGARVLLFGTGDRLRCRDLQPRVTVVLERARLDGVRGDNLAEMVARCQRRGMGSLSLLIALRFLRRHERRLAIGEAA